MTNGIKPPCEYFRKIKNEDMGVCGVDGSFHLVHPAEYCTRETRDMCIRYQHKDRPIKFAYRNIEFEK